MIETVSLTFSESRLPEATEETSPLILVPVVFHKELVPLSVRHATQSFP
jgi:hypothetical protein